MRNCITAIGATLIASSLPVPVKAHEKIIRRGVMSWDEQPPITKKVPEDMGDIVEAAEFSGWGVAFAALTNGDIMPVAEYLAPPADQLATVSPAAEFDALIGPVLARPYQAVAWQRARRSAVSSRYARFCTACAAVRADMALA